LFIGAVILSTVTELAVDTHSNFALRTCFFLYSPVSNNRFLSKCRTTFTAIRHVVLTFSQLWRCLLKDFGAKINFHTPGPVLIPHSFSTKLGQLELDRRYINAFSKGDRQVWVWTVNDSIEMRRMVNMGVHGIITDRPSVLMDFVQ